MKKLIAYILFITMALGLGARTRVTVGAERLDAYLPLLKGKKVALYTNQTGRIGDRATVDVLLENGVNVVALFSPEHGIRGTADAGEKVAGSIDTATGLPIVSLYGSKTKEAMDKTVKGADVIITDIQDVGLRYYTYYITMLRLMNSAASAGKEFMVLDRPNPLGMTVDGPILDMNYASGVGKLPIPVVHGMTLGELAQMINGEGWLNGARKVKLTVIPCEGYTHETRYKLPVAPSPNLPCMKAIYLYPSLCYFEATPVSLGRGTDFPFQVYGHPNMGGSYSFSFTPESRPGAKNPPQLGHRCYGVDLRQIPDEELIAQGINLSYLIDAYKKLGKDDKFLTSFFEKLIGNPHIREMIKQGDSAEKIKATWADDVKKFKESRRPYLLYPEK